METTMNNQTTEKKRPTHAIYMVRGEKEKGYWTRIGSAWPNKDGKGMQLVFDAIPLAGRIQLREIAEKKGDDAAGGEE
jgi:hypothetical protein